MSIYTNTYTENSLKRIEAAQRLSKSGGNGRAQALTPEQRTKIASKAARTRWNKNLQANAC